MIAFIRVLKIFLIVMALIPLTHAELLYEETGYTNPLNWSYWTANNISASCGIIGGGSIGCTGGSGWGSASLRGQGYTVASYDNISIIFNATVSLSNLNQGMIGWGHSTGDSYSNANLAQWYMEDADTASAYENNGTSFYTSVTGLNNGTVYSFKITVNSSNTLFYYKSDGERVWNLDRETTFSTVKVYPFLAHKRGDVTFTDLQICSNDICGEPAPSNALQTNLSTFYDTNNISVKLNSTLNNNLSYALNLKSNEWAYWTLDTNATDFSNNSYDGTNNGVTFAEAVIGDGGVFAGAQYIDLNTDPIDVSQPFTISLWFNASTDGAHRVFIGDGQTSNGDWLVYKSSSEQVGIFSRDNAGNFGNALTTTWNNNTWNHLLVTRINSSLLYTYVNGVLQANSTTSFGAISNPHDTTIGAGNDGTSRFMSGMLDEIRIYKYSFNSSQVTELYNKNETVICNNCTDGNFTLNNLANGLNNISMYGRTSSSLNVLTRSFTVDTIAPVITNNIPNTSTEYTLNGSLFSCTDANLFNCTITILNNTYAQGTFINLSSNGNLSYTITATDTANNTATENGYYYVNPEFKVWFNNNTAYLTNFQVNGTNYTTFFNGSIYDYGLGTHRFLFQKAGYEEHSFNVTFNTTSVINQTEFLDPVFITILLKNIANGSDAPLGNYTVLTNNEATGESATYTILNNNTVTFENEYAQNTNITVSVIDNGSITSTIELIPPREDINVTIYLNFETTATRTIEVLTGTLTAIPNTLVYLYTYIPDSDSFVLETIKETNVLGQVSFNIVELTKIYNICNTYEGNEKCLNQVTFENADTDPYQIVHDADLGTSPVNNLNYITWSYAENKTNTTSELTMTFADSNSIVSSFCYNVTRLTNDTESYIGEYCNANPSGQIVQTFGLTQDQKIVYEFYFYANSEVQYLGTYESFYEDVNLTSLKSNSVLDTLFLIIYFGVIALLLKFKNFTLYNLGVLSLLLVIFSIQAVVTQSYVSLGIWVLLFIKTVTFYFVRVET